MMRSSSSTFWKTTRPFDEIVDDRLAVLRAAEADRVRAIAGLGRALATGAVVDRLPARRRARRRACASSSSVVQ